MTDSQPNSPDPSILPEDAYEDMESIYGTLFEQLVMEIGQSGFHFLGDLQHPETGSILYDLQQAKHRVDQLEMLQMKTQGHLSPAELDLLNNTLDTLRLRVASEFQRI